MHRPHRQKVAILFSAAWIVVIGVSTGVYAYHQFACKPTVELLADGTIIRYITLRSHQSYPQPGKIMTKLRVIVGVLFSLGEQS